MKRILAAGNYTAAAQEYLRLAKLYPKSSTLYQLRAAAAYLQARRTIDAIKLIEINQVNTSQYEAAALKQVLLARLALQGNQPESALTQLSEPFPTEVPDELQEKRHRTRAEAYTLLNNYINAVQERIQLHDYLQQTDDKQRNTQELWSGLNNIKPQLLQSLHASSGQSMRSWIELAMIKQAHLFKPDLLQQSLNSWQEQYPTHPAIPAIPQQLLRLSTKYNVHPQQIAVLLPSSGKYQKAAAAIRDGFLAAWYESPNYQPNIQFYNANALNIRTNYQRAVDNGANFIVGPLEKEAIQSLAESVDIAVPTLALNKIDNIAGIESEKLSSSMLNLIQFGLSPEDESRQIAQRGIFDGHNKALVITPNTDWGERLYRAFSEEWETHGGTVLEHVTYESNTRDYRTPIKKLLNVDSSEQRFRILRGRLSRRLISEGRLREDADMVFMAAVPEAARQLVPQLRFFRADHIAVYTSSHAYSGKPEPKADRDMNNVTFLDMPWLLDQIQKGSLLQETINHYWSANTSVYRRLYALGIDAFQLIPELGRLTLQQHSSHYGKTGELYMVDTGHILRKLLWAKFTNGQAVLLDQGVNH